MRIRQTARPWALVVLLASCTGTDTPTQPPVPTTVSLSSASVTLASLGATQQLTATVQDQHGAAMPSAAVTWASSDVAVATVSSAGLVTAVRNGSATVTATSGWVSGSAVVTVQQAPATVLLSLDSLSFASLGDTAGLSAAVKDQAGYPIAGPTLSWTSSDSAVARVSATGLVTAVGNGAAAITGRAGSASDSTSVVVRQVAASVAVIPSTLTFLGTGGTQQLTAAVKDKGGAAMSTSLVWSSSNPAVASVSQTGLVTAVGFGNASVSAASASVKASAKVTVNSYGVATVTVSQGSGTLEMGETLQLTATTRDASGRVLTAPPVAWVSYDSSVVTVSNAGLVKAIAPGITSVVARSEGKSGGVDIMVTNSSIGSVQSLGPSQFVLIQPGTFQMGSATGESDERPVHTVNITKTFYLQKTEVTQRQWREVMGFNPSRFTLCGDDCPVESVSWNHIQVFLSRLNVLNPGANYRLPTEAEWEYAARAGTTGDYGGNGVLNDMGWYGGNSDSRTHPVAQKLPNHWGLYDMFGNVWEWLQDWYSENYYSVSPSNDPTGPSTGTSRVARGCSWGGSDYYGLLCARSAYRGGPGGAPDDRASEVGLRLARTP